MKRIHLGHHFFGAGNLGDDFMLAGFLTMLRPCRGQVELTCCVPHPRERLARRFPEIGWLPYDETTRRTAIDACDAWLGLGGSPFQCAVSRWFVDHLDAERQWCAAARKPMFFLGVGGQDPVAYALPELREICAQAVKIWTRDDTTAEALARTLPTANVRPAADLSHLFFAENPPPAAARGRLTAVLNFDYAGWPALGPALTALDAVPARERVWLAQEARPLPGAEQWLYDQLLAAQQARWRLQAADTGEDVLAAVLARWPSGEWLLTSRFHATLAGAWAGSRIVALATNDKLRGVAREFGLPLLELTGDVKNLPALFAQAKPADPTRLQARAAAARQACVEFAAEIDLRPA